MLTYREGFDEEVVEVRPGPDALLQRFSLRAEFVVGKLGHGRPHGVDGVDAILVPHASFLSGVALHQAPDAALNLVEDGVALEGSAAGRCLDGAMETRRLPANGLACHGAARGERCGSSRCSRHAGHLSCLRLRKEGEGSVAR